jgi:hypothetical protein
VKFGFENQFGARHSGQSGSIKAEIRLQAGGRATKRQFALARGPGFMSAQA